MISKVHKDYIIDYVEYHLLLADRKTPYSTAPTTASTNDSNAQLNPKVNAVYINAPIIMKFNGIAITGLPIIISNGVRLE